MSAGASRGSTGANDHRSVPSGARVLRAPERGVPSSRRAGTSRGGFPRAAAHRAQRRAVAIARRAQRRRGVVFAPNHPEASGRVASSIWSTGCAVARDGTRHVPSAANRGSGRRVAGGVGEGEPSDAELDGVLAAGVREDEVAALVESAAGPGRDGERVGVRATEPGGGTRRGIRRRRGGARGGGRPRGGGRGGAPRARARTSRSRGGSPDARRPSPSPSPSPSRRRRGRRRGRGRRRARETGVPCGRRERAVRDARGERGGELDALGDKAVSHRRPQDAKRVGGTRRAGPQRVGRGGVGARAARSSPAPRRRGEDATPIRPCRRTSSAAPRVRSSLPPCARGAMSSRSSSSSRSTALMARAACRRRRRCYTPRAATTREIVVLMIDSRIIE